jgi:dTDP-glucose 4,6-dehydratase
LSEKQNILVTGGAGFIGSAFCRLVSANPKNNLVILDKLSYASNLDAIKNVIIKKNVSFLKGSIGDAILVQKTLKDFPPKYIINFAAETHVDNSIINPKLFIDTNIVDTYNFLETTLSYYKKLEDKEASNFKFLQVSTDEVYGDIEPGEKAVSEVAPYKPSSPYSATKAAGDHLIKSYFRTFDFPGLISNCSNNYGPFQHEEKFIPKVINSVLNKKKIPIYGNGKQLREWIFVDDHCKALIKLLENGLPGESYNIGNGNELTNLEVVQCILKALESLSLISTINLKDHINFVEDRLGHDKRYAIDSSKIQKLCNWKSDTKFEIGLKKTISSIIDLN